MSNIGKIGKRFSKIQTILNENLNPKIINIIDESYKHRGHQGMIGKEVDETHFEVEIVSEKFEGLSLIERHRIVNRLLEEEFKNGLHALSLKTKTVKEYEKKNKN